MEKIINGAINILAYFVIFWEVVFLYGSDKIDEMSPYPAILNCQCTINSRWLQSSLGN